MADYYLDIETNPTGEKIDLKNDRILTIQYQPIDCRTGEPKGDLVILKAWESSEKDILQRFYQIFQPDSPWTFVPVGFNLVFDYFSLIYRWRTIDIRVDARAVFHDRPNIDLKAVIVLCNCGKFTGSKLSNYRQEGLRGHGGRLVQGRGLRRHQGLYPRRNREIPAVLPPPSSQYAAVLGRMRPGKWYHRIVGSISSYPAA